MQVTKPHVNKGDTVMVIAGKEKSKTGKILHLLPKKNGVIKEKEARIHISNVMPYCSKCSKPVRTSVKLLENGEKQRLCVKCGTTL